jgi:hypothetical protein
MLDILGVLEDGKTFVAFNCEPRVDPQHLRGFFPGLLKADTVDPIGAQAPANQRCAVGERQQARSNVGASGQRTLQRNRVPQGQSRFDRSRIRHQVLAHLSGFLSSLEF